MDSGRPAAFLRFPVLSTDRLILREITVRDAAFWMRNFSDPTTVAFSAYDPPKDVAAAKEEIRRYCIRPFADGKGIRWGIERRDLAELIGTLGYHRWVREELNSAEMGYELLPEHRRRGIMAEAMTAVLGFGFEQMRLHRAEVRTDPTNLPSIRLLEKLGFHREAVLRETTHFRDRYIDDAVYSLLDREWRTRAGNR